MAFKICMIVLINCCYCCSHKPLAQEQCEKLVSEMFDGSLRLLDVCDMARDALLQTKECTCELQSTLHRRPSNKMEISGELQSKSSSWSSVSKLVHHKRVPCECEETDANEFEMVDAALQSLISHKPSKSDYSLVIDNVQTWLGKLKLNIQDLEEVFECLSRSIVKTRVSLLNILNH
uniref:Uncharacterized protein n=1 Tax=Quercus lobata TaxID=97700 RepID=A0A7N2R097_QUELO